MYAQATFETTCNETLISDWRGGVSVTGITQENAPVCTVPPAGLQMLSETIIKKGVAPVYLAAVLCQGCTSVETVGFLQSMQQVDTGE